jgi:energy-coupling factor transport system substrate-specific component
MSQEKMNKPKTWLASWTTKDILLLAAISVVFALVIAGLNVLSAVLLAVNPLLAVSFSGLCFLPGILIMLIIRRPGTCILTRIIINLMMIPFTPFGWGPLVFEIIFGVLSEIPFAVRRYRDFRMPVAIIAGLIPGLLSFIAMFGIGMLGNLIPVLQIAALIIFLLSGALLGGVMAVFISRTIAKTGVLNSFAIRVNINN